MPHLEQGDFRRDTGRYAAVGLYMWSGGDFFAPHIGPDTPYFNKPPLALWLHGLSLKLLGRNLIAARLPSILAALGVLTLSVLTAKKLATRTEALVSGIVLALSYDFFRRTREISLDFWQLLFVMLAVFWFATALRENKRRYVLLSGLGIGLALLCKPFVALGTLPVFALWAISAGRRRLLAPILVGAIPLALLIALPWHWYMYSRFDDSFVRQYIFHEVVGRARGIEGHETYYYYLRQLISTYWLWLLPVLWAAYYRFFSEVRHRTRQRDLVLLGGIWVVCVFAFISLFADKSPNYSLPLFPMLSWIAAAGLCRLPWPLLYRWRRIHFRGLAPAALLCLVLLSVLPIRFQAGPNKDWQAFFRWMRGQSATPEQFAQEGLKPNRRCYFYIKTGYWLPSYSNTAPNTAIRWILRDADNAKEEKPNPSAIFRSGPLRITPANEPLPSTPSKSLPHSTAPS